MNQTVHNIMVGIDFSDCTDQVVQFAAKLAAQLGSKLCLVHVHVPVPVAGIGPMIPDPLPFTQVENDAEVTARLQAALQTLSDRLIGNRVPTTLQVYVGDASLSLEAAVEHMQPDLIIVGSHGRGMLMRLLLGSVSSYISQHSPVPVLLVPAPSRGRPMLTLNGQEHMMGDMAPASA